jgi:hypothetical protein
MFASLTVHTEVTLAAGREELQKYSDLIKVLFNFSIFKFSVIGFRNINNTFRSLSLGTSQKRILTSTFLMTLNEKERHATTTPSQMKKRIGHSKNSICLTQTSRIRIPR